MFSEYIKLYYGGEAVGNFYVLESGDNPKNFSCGFFAKKCTYGMTKIALRVRNLKDIGIHLILLTQLRMEGKFRII